MKRLNPSYRQSFIFLSLIITILTLVAIIYINQNKEDKMQGYYQQNITAVEIAYKASLNKYNFFANRIFENRINKPKKLVHMYNSLTAIEESSKRYHKGLLYKELAYILDNFKKVGLRQLHFHTKDNHSFIRFHKPQKHGDDLSSFRDTVAYVNRYKTPIKAFETGRVVSGFRNVFPLFYNKAHIGSVEISISFQAMMNSVKELIPENEFVFMLNKNLIDKKIFKTQEYLYSDSIINPNFVQEDSNSLLPDSPKPVSQIVKDINKRLSQDKNIKAKMENKEKFATFIKLDDKIYYDVIFIPMIGIDNSLEGYLISYSKTENLPGIVHFLPWFITTIIIFYIMSVIFLYIIKNKSQEVAEQKNWFLDVNDSLGDGMYVVDNDANIVYANPMTSTILGFDKEELIGKSAHYTFHSHEENRNIPLEDCPILNAVKENGSIESVSEYFKTKDGRRIPVELNSQALYKEGKINQIVTTFKDISIRKGLESRMRLLTKALESSSDTIVITDKDANIEWANPAFEKLTGYSLMEVLGKQPKEFISSGKHSKEFYKDMWDTILSKKAWSGEIINKKKDGTYYYEGLSITPVLNAQKEIQNFIAIKKDISERKEREKNIEHFAYYDHLTNLPNRRLFNEHLSRILKSLQREDKYVALLFLDMDKFKQLNDTLGHDYGDEFLRQVSARLERTVRAHDIVARLGGDEFVIILDNLPVNKISAQSSCEKIAEKILKAVRKPFRLDEEHRYESSTSIGIYIFDKEEKDIENIIKKSDIALYEAKGKGRDTYHIFDEK